MSEISTFQQQFKIIGPDGTIFYGGSSRIMNPIDVTSAETGTNTILVDAPVRINSSSVFAPSAATASLTQPVTETILINRSTGALDTVMLGVTSFGAITAGSRSAVAGTGSIVPVRAKDSTVSTIGFPQQTIASGPVQAVTDAAARSATIPAYGTVLGMCVFIGPGATVTGTNYVGVLVGPY